MIKQGHYAVIVLNVSYPKTSLVVKIRIRVLKINHGSIP